MDPPPTSEKSHLINERNAKIYSLKINSEFSGSKESCPNLPLGNGDMAGAIELKRPVGSHCHGKKAAFDESHEKLIAKKKLYIASIVCLVFMIGEVIGGYLAHSLAIMTDAAHLLTDFGSMMVSLFSLWISSRPPTKIMNFGWHRSEILGALISVMSIWIVTGVLVYLAIERIPEYKVADPICTFLFSVFVLGTTITILRDVFRILMEGAPKGIEFNSVKEVLLSLKAVKAMHSLHLWALTIGQSMVSVHIAIEENADPHSVLKEATELLQTKFGFYNTTIQVEPYCEDMIHCTQCQDPMD
ncbi:zinc transporter 3 [Labeo rohita]|uniref:Probable proton-coupled zinc antiporter SLC30A3 n=1 Tax=Labeo rohita TaxID=84645 RepID=A0A498LDG0_LABRO|nr:zinc transporter 3 [Labeo rohita]